MTAQELLRGLSDKIGLPGLVFDQNAACELIFDDKLKIDLHVSPDQATLNLVIVLGTWRSDQQLSLFRELLHANNSPATLHELVFSIDPAYRQVLLGRAFLVSVLTVEELSDYLEKMLNVAEEWAPRLATMGWIDSVI